LVTEWADRFGSRVDPKFGHTLAKSGFGEDLERELKLAEFLVDLEDHNIEVRPKPNSKHNLPSFCSSRGGKVEIFHNPANHFANLGCRAKLYQALQMEGTTRHNADRREDAKQQVGPDGDNSARKATSVAHYRPWVRVECNKLAVAAGHAQPYPEDGCVRPVDNDERFFFEYAVQQEEREKEWGREYTAADILTAGGCPCSECDATREELRRDDDEGGGGGGDGGGGVDLPATRVFGAMGSSRALARAASTASSAVAIGGAAATPAAGAMKVAPQTAVASPVAAAMEVAAEAVAASPVAGAMEVAAHTAVASPAAAAMEVAAEAAAPAMAAGGRRGHMPAMRAALLQPLVLPRPTGACPIPFTFPMPFAVDHGLPPPPPSQSPSNQLPPEVARAKKSPVTSPSAIAALLLRRVAYEKQRAALLALVGHMKDTRSPARLKCGEANSAPAKRQIGGPSPRLALACFRVVSYCCLQLQ
jgi:hypothetical protein